MPYLMVGSVPLIPWRGKRLLSCKGDDFHSQRATRAQPRARCPEGQERRIPSQKGPEGLDGEKLHQQNQKENGQSVPRDAGIPEGMTKKYLSAERTEARNHRSSMKLKGDEQNTRRRNQIEETSAKLHDSAQGEKMEERLASPNQLAGRGAKTVH